MLALNQTLKVQNKENFIDLQEKFTTQIFQQEQINMIKRKYGLKSNLSQFKIPSGCKDLFNFYTISPLNLTFCPCVRLKQITVFT